MPQGVVEGLSGCRSATIHLPGVKGMHIQEPWFSVISEGVTKQIPRCLHSAAMVQEEELLSG